MHPFTDANINTQEVKFGIIDPTINMVTTCGMLSNIDQEGNMNTTIEMHHLLIIVLMEENSEFLS